MKPKLSKDQRRKKKVAGRSARKTKDHYIRGTLNGKAPFDWITEASEIRR